MIMPTLVLGSWKVNLQGDLVDGWVHLYARKRRDAASYNVQAPVEGLPYTTPVIP